MANKKTPELRFIVETKKSDDLAIFHARVVYIDPQDGRVKNPLADTWSSEAWQEGVADLVVRAQADLVEGRFYGYEVEYSQPYSVRLRRAEAMVKSLRKINRHLEKLENEFGFAGDLFTYLARVGNAIGVTSYGFCTARSASFYADNEYAWGTIDQARYRIEEAVKALSGVKA